MDGRGSKSATMTKNPSLADASFDENITILSAVAMKAFSEAFSNYKTSGTFLEEDAASLAFLFGPTIEAVLDLVDECKVTVMKTPMSGKVLVRVYGTRVEPYWISPGKSVCQCKHYVIGKKGYCKHVLASHVALALHSPEEYEDISEAELTEIYRTKILKLKK